jgi:hypothetical protein
MKLEGLAQRRFESQSPLLASMVSKLCRKVLQDLGFCDLSISSFLIIMFNRGIQYDKY